MTAAELLAVAKSWVSEAYQRVCALGEDGYVLVNSGRRIENLALPATAVRQRFVGPVGRANAEAAATAYRAVRVEIEELEHA